MTVVAAAVIGSAVVGGVVASNSASKASKSADKATAAQAQAAGDATALGYDQLEFDKLQYNDGKALRDSAAQTAIDVAKQQLASSKTNDALAADYAAYNKDTFRPLEQKIVSDAQGYDTPERRAAAQAEAAASVEQGYGQAQAGLQRTLMRNNVTADSGRSQALMQDAALSKAKALAGATTAASKQVETVGAARMADAANLGRGLPSAQATSAGVALNAGNSAVNNGMQAINAQQAGIGNVNQGYAGAIGANISAGNLYGQAANTYNSIANAGNQALGGLGGVLGQYAGSAAGSKQIATWLSDEGKKKNTDTPADTATMLRQVVATPVRKGWQYDPAKGGPDDGGVPHDGPMAQDVRAHMGEAAAPGGTTIDPITMNGRLMGSMQELAKNQKKLDKRLARIESTERAEARTERKEAA